MDDYADVDADAVSGAGEAPRTRRVSEVTPRPVTWLWPERVPRGKVTLLDGDPGLGKTTILLDLAARISSGRPMPGETNGGAREPAGVLYLSAEDDEGDTLRPRLEAAGADLDRVHLWAEPRLPTLPDDVNRIFVHLVVEFDVSLVVFDPAGAFLAEELNPHRDADVRQALAPLRGACEATGAAAVLLRHLNKDGKSSNALYRGGGSIAFIAAARSALLVAPDPDNPDQLVLAHTKSNVGRRARSLAYQLAAVQVPRAGDQVRVEWRGEVDTNAADLLVTKGRAPSEKRSACVEWLLERLSGGGVVAFSRIRDEAEARGWGERMLRRAADDLGVTKEREARAAGGTLWRL